MATRDAQTPPQLSEEKIKELFAASQEAKSRAYAPYSNFNVGAALLTTEGKVFQGSCIKNGRGTVLILAPPPNSNIQSKQKGLGS